MEEILPAYARRTNRLRDQQCQVGFDLGGEGGSRLLDSLAMPTSADTLLRMIRNAKEPSRKTPRVLGVDDWALCKGQSYGTILGDLETHQVVDLLPQRSAESFAKWLEEHPGVEIISRDRGKEYIKGATTGAPDAIQVADRWHLLKNLRETIQRFLEDTPKCLQITESSRVEQSTKSESPKGCVELAQTKQAQEKRDNKAINPHQPSPESLQIDQQLSSASLSSKSGKQPFRLQIKNHSTSVKSVERVQANHQPLLEEESSTIHCTLSNAALTKVALLNATNQPTIVS